MHVRLGWFHKGHSVGRKGASLVCVGGKITEIHAAKSSISGSNFLKKFQRLKGQ